MDKFDKQAWRLLGQARAHMAHTSFTSEYLRKNTADLIDEIDELFKDLRESIEDDEAEAEEA